MSVQHVTDARRVADADELLDGLNPQQRQAVLHEGSPLLIVALILKEHLWPTVAPNLPPD